jgi:hypothetical protein
LQHVRQTFRKLKARFNPRKSNGVSTLMIPDDNSTSKNPTYKIIKNPKDIENLLLQRNVQHFGQAQGSAFTVGPLKNHFGYEGINDNSQNLIQGNDFYDLIDSVGPGEQRILRALNDGSNADTIDIGIPLLEFKKGFQKWRETTSTSPSGRHLGHYKALLRTEIRKQKQNEDNDDPSDKETIPKQQQKRQQTKHPLGHAIFRVLHHVAMAALRSGETLSRWTTAHSTMIEKDPGRPIISRLRVIHLFEADYNMIIKV